MKLHTNLNRVIGIRSQMLYGHFIEHFHRQIYGGVYDPGSPLADEDGFRTDVIEAMKKIKVPILRWPGGCFVSSYHWKAAVGKERQPFFDKAWRVEDPNTFGTDEYIRLCRKIGCEPYICTNAGTGTAEEMSDWVEYCNLREEGRYARWRIANGYEEPHKVRYWSIGNENYGYWEIGAKPSGEWGRLVKESAKMIKHVDPTTELSAAALTDIHWNLELLEESGDFLDWISIHEYWDGIHQTNDYADYEQVMAYTHDIGHSIREVRGLLEALKLEKKIRIAFDEWNLRGWYHPNVHTVRQGITKEEYLYPRDKNDDNTEYTMADAVFTACFLNELNRNCDIVGMANFAPIVNTRGCIFTHSEGIVLRSTYHVFDLYVNYLGDVVLDTWSEEMPTLEVTSKKGEKLVIDALDLVVTKWSDRPGIALAVVNKDPDRTHSITLPLEVSGSRVMKYTVRGNSIESYNDVDHEEVRIEKTEPGMYEEGMEIMLEAHSINVIQIV
ncbi:MAG: alpha-L-arabinofuranosidase C-terminal domain-containing protein [Lachnospiraceae bacterium]|nr:alpha-L-arabinofuranosidase C-terminal domain-containing protein [Lachnospiraceae bacterium]